MSRREFAPVAQLVLRELDDGRIEVCILHRGPESMPHILMRMFLASLAPVADVRELAAQFAEGKRQVSGVIDLAAEAEPILSWTSGPVAQA